MANPKLIILGGGSPFTAGLLEALVQRAPELPPFELVLYGRKQEALETMARYAQLLNAPSNTLFLKVSCRSNLKKALEGADVILNQIRFGGNAGRKSDEKFALEFGVPPDETLGPAGFRAALRSLPELRELAQQVKESAPDAWFINLSNPLSQTVRLLSRAGLKQVIGLCELPRTTFESACERLEVQPRQTHWSYTGLNHRGFITRLEKDGENLLPRLAALLDGSPLGKMNGDVIRELKALPLKYYSLYRQVGFGGSGRATFVSNLRLQLSHELEKQYPNPGPLLANRPPLWYDKAVLPLLISLFQNRGDELLINAYIPEQDISLEIKARVFTRGWVPSPTEGPPPSPAVSSWLRRLARHESAQAAALDRPNRANIYQALESDPLAGHTHISEITRELMEVCSTASINE